MTVRYGERRPVPSPMYAWETGRVRVFRDAAGYAEPKPNAEKKTLSLTLSHAYTGEGTIRSTATIEQLHPTNKGVRK